MDGESYELVGIEKDFSTFLYNVALLCSDRKPNELQEGLKREKVVGCVGATATRGCGYYVPHADGLFPDYPWTFVATFDNPQLVPPLESGGAFQFLTTPRGASKRKRGTPFFHGFVRWATVALTMFPFLHACPPGCQIICHHK